MERAKGAGNRHTNPALHGENTMEGEMRWMERGRAQDNEVHHTLMSIFFIVEDRANNH